MKKKKIELRTKLLLNKDIIAALTHDIVGGWKETDPNHGCIPPTTDTGCVNTVCLQNCQHNISYPATMCCGFGQTVVMPCQQQTVNVGGTC